jgi:hypothetical protein
MTYRMGQLGVTAEQGLPEHVAPLPTTGGFATPTER